jgi:hypothetical protein
MKVLFHELAHTTQPGGETIQRMPRITSWDFRASTSDATAPDNCAPGLQIGAVKLGVDSKQYGPGSFTNGVELRANIADHQEGTKYDIKRTKEASVWEKVASTWNNRHYEGPGADDDPDNMDECLTPSRNPPPLHIYSLDGPGLTDVAWADPAATEIVAKWTFFENVDITPPIGVGVETIPFAWHSIVWLTKHDGTWTMDKKRSEIARGKIKVDTP